MRKNRSAVMFVLSAFAVSACLVGSLALAKGKPSPLDCPRDILCPDVYDPVTCDGGVVYPNACYAYAACATGCGAPGS
jgi:hypothetical protein